MKIIDGVQYVGIFDAPEEFHGNYFAAYSGQLPQDFSDRYLCESITQRFVDGQAFTIYQLLNQKAIVGDVVTVYKRPSGEKEYVCHEKQIIYICGLWRTHESDLTGCEKLGDVVCQNRFWGERDYNDEIAIQRMDTWATICKIRIILKSQQVDPYQVLEIARVLNTSIVEVVDVNEMEGIKEGQHVM